MDQPEQDERNNEKDRLLYKKQSNSFWQLKCLQCIPTRYTIVLVTFLGFVNVYALRVNLSMAIVAMVNNSAVNNPGNSSSHKSHLVRPSLFENPFSLVTLIIPMVTSNMTGAQHNKTAKHLINYNLYYVGWVLSGFYYGYLVLQIPGGYLSDRFGARYVFGLGVLLTSVTTLFTPLAAQLHIGALIGVRVLEGFFEGVTYPAALSLLGKWSPPKERSIMATMTYAGTTCGSILAFPVSALLCEYGFAGGWPSVFYVFGGIGIVWFVLWLFVAFDSPEKHPRISSEERIYIQSSIEADNVVKHNQKVPWLSIMMSPAVWALVVGFVCYSWGFYTLLSCIPSYYSDVLQLKLGKNLVQNGVFSAIPYVGFLIATLSGGQLADWLRRRGVSTVIVRKIFNTTAFVVAGMTLLIIGYIGSSKIVCVVLMTVSVAFSGFMTSGILINQVDIAPQFSGIIMGICNMAATVPGIVGPLVAKTIAHVPALGPGDIATYREEWREVFIVAAELYMFGAIVFIILGRGERQWWAGGTEENVPAKRQIQENGETFEHSTFLNH